MMASASNRGPEDRAPAESGEYLVVGQVLGARGLSGELRIRIESDDPERFYALESVYLGDERRHYRVQAARLFKGHALLRLTGVSDRTTAERLRGEYVYVSVDEALPLAEGEYYYHQIQGLRVRTDTGEELGRVTEILATGANDVWVVKGPQGEVLLPAIKEVILSVDLENELLTVHLLEGLR